MTLPTRKNSKNDENTGDLTKMIGDKSATDKPLSSDEENQSSSVKGKVPEKTPDTPKNPEESSGKEGKELAEKYKRLTN